MLTNSDVGFEVHGGWSWRLGHRFRFTRYGFRNVWGRVELLLGVRLTGRRETSVGGGVLPVEETGEVLCVQVITVVTCLVCQKKLSDMKDMT